MDKLHIWRLLLLLAVTVTSSTQRSTSAFVDDNDVEEGDWPLRQFAEISMLASLATAPDDAYAPPPMPPPSSHRPIIIADHPIALSTPRKRGFSMLARWKPFNSLGRQRTSIRNINRQLFPAAAAAAAAVGAGEYDVVSAETRALSRPSGQPLRWG